MNKEPRDTHDANYSLVPPGPMFKEGTAAKNPDNHRSHVCCHHCLVSEDGSMSLHTTDLHHCDEAQTRCPHCGLFFVYMEDALSHWKECAADPLQDILLEILRISKEIEDKRTTVNIGAGYGRTYVSSEQVAGCGCWIRAYTTPVHETNCWVTRLRGLTDGTWARAKWEEDQGRSNKS